MWDNHATQHYAVADFETQPREVSRITIAGDIPVSVDGRQSIPLTGEAGSYSDISTLVS